MKKFQFILIVFLANYAVALLFIKYSKVCSHYAEKSFNSIFDFMGLVASIPLYWGMGLFVLFPILWIIFDQLPNSINGIIKEPIIFPFGGAVLSVMSIVVFRRKLNQTAKKSLILFLTICLNIAALESFFISMGV
jgi:uncharacterized membrane protein YhdT